MEDNQNHITADVGGNYVLCPPGNHIANCFAMITVGTVMESFQGKPPVPVKKLFIGFEITEKKHVFKEEKGEEPFIIWVEYLLSLNKKANLRKMIESWAGQTYTDEQMKEFKLDSLIGASCYAMVIADKTKDGKDRSKIAAISAVPEKIQIPEMINKPLLFVYKNPFDQATFDRIPEWIQKKMKTSSEYAQALNGGIIPPATTAGSNVPPPAEKKKGFPFPPTKPL